jgi:gamma-glutamylcysteine synthetase
MLRSEAAQADLAERFEGRFRSHLGPVRRVGREAEFPIVDADGRAADLRPLWKRLQQEPGFVPEYDSPRGRRLLVALRAPGLALATEVGRSTLEISIGPYDDLRELEAGLRAALQIVGRHALPLGLHVLGYGIQPRTPASVRLMTPRRHYRAFQRAFGRSWLPLTSTASDQVHIDITRQEILPAVNAMNLLSGPLIALCANSSIYSGRAGAYLSGREALLRSLGEVRYGMTPRRLRSVSELVAYLCRFPCPVLPIGGRFRAFGRPFDEWLATGAARHTPHRRFEEFLWHDHYIWNSARARVTHSTIEVRAACQQPPGESLAANALALGWAESLEPVLEYFQRTLAEEAWPRMRQYRRAAVRDGLKADTPVRGMLAELASIAAQGLAHRARGEERWLGAVQERLARRENPAMQARRSYRRGGVKALVEALTLPQE